ncbi:MAG: carbon-nitrogen hydrolase family protein, partial [Paenibacillaceae bacterium]|nr:carbon-nitrogen hydrolase family protein [Paenibacillaceae bacterium]
MKIAYIQPSYPDHTSMFPLDCIHFMLKKAKELDEGTDLLVLPEYANCPGLNDFAELTRFIEQDSAGFLDELSEIAKNKQIHIVSNIIRNRANNWRNSTVWIDRSGNRLAEYDKTHLTSFEKEGLHFTQGDEVRFLEVEGVKVVFATCFELYFAEYFARLAALKPDLIVVPTYQRSENSELLQLQASARAMDSGAFLLRCAYSMGVMSQTGGMSMLVHPRGNV